MSEKICEDRTKQLQNEIIRLRRKVSSSDKDTRKPKTYYHDYEAPKKIVKGILIYIIDSSDRYNAYIYA